MIFENTKHNCISCTIERMEEVPTYAQLLEAMAQSIDIDFVDLLNEGYPVMWGNDCGAFEFTAYQDGYLYQYSLGGTEMQDLACSHFCTFVPFAWVDLEA